MQQENSSKKATAGAPKKSGGSRSNARNASKASHQQPQNSAAKRNGNQRGRRRKGGRKKNSPAAPSVKISFLGGLNEIGKNMTLYEFDGEMIIVDCGLAFPEPDMLGVDLVIPDFTYVQRNADRIRGIFITHGHEDHIGGLAYLLKVVNIPVYGTPLSIGLIRGKLEEHGILNQCDLRVIKPGDSV